MSIAALYDIHSNLPALEAVMAEVRQANVEAIVIGGDVVPGPMPRETLDYLSRLDLPVHFIRGNGDREILLRMQGQETSTAPASFRESMHWVVGRLGPHDAEWIASWPETLELSIPTLGKVLFCHATPRNDIEIFTRLTLDSALLPVFAGVTAPLVVCGHTHMPFDRTLGQLRIVNAGSVGMPFGPAGADWLLLGPGVDFRRTVYDLNAAANRIAATSYPQAQSFAERNILNPPDEQEMLQTFTKAGLQ